MDDHNASYPVWFKASKNMGVDKSDANSRCIHLVAKHTNEHKKAFRVLIPLRLVGFIVKGPQKSTPVSTKGLSLAVTLAQGRLTIIG
ncbi:hypothetical protein HHI36_003112 [Cryptolaemus montrouzieri]|uniref:Uncharacterized protein n=1 Tax=Cryptolaemus montrouzieri TaxID=559131 RepID=A0ABD2PCH7_9CUCU